jgi:hypothetical protein
MDGGAAVFVKANSESLTRASADPGLTLTDGFTVAFWLNPAVAIADGFRWAWLDWSVWQPAHALSFASGGIVFGAGLLSLRYQSRRISEFL